MPLLDKSAVLERFRRDAINSSHFVWLLADLRYYECENGWIFAFAQVGDVTLLALEPLVPGGPQSYGPEHAGQFRVAWDEFSTHNRVRIAAFVSVYDPFLGLLKSEGFAAVKCGEEPWVDLNDCIPTGNAGKGVRNARNQALQAGLSVEEWKAADIVADSGKRAILSEIHEEWRSRHVVELGGFMNATDPFAYMEERRYFVVRSPSRVEAYLVATPVPALGGYFLEDLVSRDRAPRGSGELVTLEAMVALGQMGAHTSSLGVVSMTTMDPKGASGLPPFIRFLLYTIPKYMHAIYNFDGLEVYRKRFKPRLWRNVNVAAKDTEAPPRAKFSAGTMAWLKVILALLLAFRPRLRITRRWLARAALQPLRRYPIAISATLASILPLALVNHFGHLPQNTLARFGFTAHAPWREWVFRSAISDFLYFDFGHFLSCAPPFIFLLAWAERTHRRRFLLFFLAGAIAFNDVINYWVLIKPFEYFHPSLFHNLISYKDVGGSLLLITVLGLQICQFRFLREPLFAVLTLSVVLIFAFTSAEHKWLVLNLNHTLFLVLGFLTGKAEFEYGRHLSRLASKRKPPSAPSVLPPTPSLPQKKAA